MTNNGLKIGLSLSPVYLTQQPGNVDTQWFGPPAAFLQEVREAGATHIELRAITPSTDPAMGEAALRQVWAAGLEATIHGTLPTNTDDDWIKTLHPLIHLLRMVTKRQPDTLCPVTVHARAAAAGGDVAALADQTVVILSRIAGWIAQEGLAAILALEINRAKGQADPSTTYRGVCDMQQRVGLANVGICWDMGHTYSNILTESLDPMPPAEFLSAVRHTHIHDLGPSGITHWPLTEGRMPLKRFAQGLKSAGYQGVWNLELGPNRYATEADIRQRVVRSVRMLIDAVAG